MALRRRRTRIGRRARRGGRRLRGVTAVGYRGAYPSMPSFRAVRRGGNAIAKRVKRARSRTRTVTRTKRRRVMDPAGYTQWNSSKFTKSLGRLTQRKMNLIGTNIMDLIWKRTGRLDVGGQMYLGSWNTIDETKAFRPIFLFDLTSTKQFNATAKPAYQLIRNFDVSGGSYTFSEQSGYTLNGISLAPEWQQAVSDQSAVGVGNRALLKWTEIRADIWGAKEHPCEWVFTLCQIDERVLPKSQDYSEVTDEAATQFWDSFSQQLVFSPSDRKVNEGIFGNSIKVLDRRSFVINPTSTTETDADPHVRSVRMFYKMNRRLNFAWEDRAPAVFEESTAADPAQNPSFKRWTVTDPAIYVQQKARVFMMVTCKCWRAPPLGYDLLTPSNTPTFNFGVYSRYITNGI